MPSSRVAAGVFLLAPLFLAAVLVPLLADAAGDVCDTASEAAKGKVTNDCIACITVVENGQQVKKEVGAICKVTGGGDKTAANCVPGTSPTNPPPGTCKTKYCVGTKCFDANLTTKPTEGSWIPQNTSDLSKLHNDLSWGGVSVSPISSDQSPIPDKSFFDSAQYSGSDFQGADPFSQPDATSKYLQDLQDQVDRAQANTPNPSLNQPAEPTNYIQEALRRLGVSFPGLDEQAAQLEAVSDKSQLEQMAKQQPVPTQSTGFTASEIDTKPPAEPAWFDSARRWIAQQLGIGAEAAVPRLVPDGKGGYRLAPGTNFSEADKNPPRSSANQIQGLDGPAVYKSTHYKNPSGLTGSGAKFDDITIACNACPMGTSGQLDFLDKSGNVVYSKQMVVKEWGDLQPGVGIDINTQTVRDAQAKTGIPFLQEGVTGTTHSGGVRFTPEAVFQGRIPGDGWYADRAAVQVAEQYANARNAGYSPAEAISQLTSGQVTYKSAYVFGSEVPSPFTLASAAPAPSDSYAPSWIASTPGFIAANTAGSPDVSPFSATYDITSYGPAAPPASESYLPSWIASIPGFDSGVPSYVTPFSPSADIAEYELSPEYFGPSGAENISVVLPDQFPDSLMHGDTAEAMRLIEEGALGKLPEPQIVAQLSGGTTRGIGLLRSDASGLPANFDSSAFDSGVSLTQEEVQTALDTAEATRLAESDALASGFPGLTPLTPQEISDAYERYGKEQARLALEGYKAQDLALDTGSGISYPIDWDKLAFTDSGFDKPQDFAGITADESQRTTRDLANFTIDESQRTAPSTPYDVAGVNADEFQRTSQDLAAITEDESQRTARQEPDLRGITEDESQRTAPQESKVADLTKCASESCVGGEIIGDERSVPLTDEQLAAKVAAEEERIFNEEQARLAQIVEKAQKAGDDVKAAAEKVKAAGKDFLAGGSPQGLIDAGNELKAKVAEYEKAYKELKSSGVLSSSELKKIDADRALVQNDLNEISTWKGRLETAVNVASKVSIAGDRFGSTFGNPELGRQAYEQAVETVRQNLRKPENQAQINSATERIMGPVGRLAAIPSYEPKSYVPPPSSELQLAANPGGPTFVFTDPYESTSDSPPLDFSSGAVAQETPIPPLSLDYDDYGLAEIRQYQAEQAASQYDSYGDEAIRQYYAEQIRENQEAYVAFSKVEFPKTWPYPISEMPDYFAESGRPTPALSLLDQYAEGGAPDLAQIARDAGLAQEDLRDSSSGLLYPPAESSEERKWPVLVYTDPDAEYNVAAQKAGEERAIALADAEEKSAFDRWYENLVLDGKYDPSPYEVPAGAVSLPEEIWDRVALNRPSSDHESDEPYRPSSEPGRDAPSPEFLRQQEQIALGLNPSEGFQRGGLEPGITPTKVVPELVSRQVPENIESTQADGTPKSPLSLAAAQPSTAPTRSADAKPVEARAPLPIEVPTVGDAKTPYDLWGKDLPSKEIRSKLYNQLAEEGFVNVERYTGTGDQNRALIDGLKERQQATAVPNPYARAQKVYSEGDSIVDFLSAGNMKSDFGSRRSLFDSVVGYGTYTGTASQNQALLELLRKRGDQ
ncbi:hypothetical protein HYW59_01260 [Candidatus Kaiserbacteria bacterium]|nr:hypothetical protein [Candidatus Kaiserbacteria bacterium]